MRLVVSQHKLAQEAFWGDPKHLLLNKTVHEIGVAGLAQTAARKVPEAHSLRRPDHCGAFGQLHTGFV